MTSKWRRKALRAVLVLACMTGPLPAWAADGQAQGGSPSQGQDVWLPLDVGVGPAAYFLFGHRTMEHQLVDVGLKINVNTVLTGQFMHDRSNVLPKEWKPFNVGIDEVALPLWWVPDSLFISPNVLGKNGMGAYGATWKPISFGLPLTQGTVRIRVRAALDVTYAYLFAGSNYTDFPATHFIRPGAELGLDVRFQLSKRALLNVGWESQLYIPQELGGFGISKTFNDNLAHIGQAYLQFHYRFAYETHLTPG